MNFKKIKDVGGREFYINLKNINYIYKEDFYCRYRIVFNGDNNSDVVISPKVKNKLISLIWDEWLEEKLQSKDKENPK
jgi:hypothetical protein